MLVTYQNWLDVCQILINVWNYLYAKEGVFDNRCVSKHKLNHYFKNLTSPNSRILAYSSVRSALILDCHPMYKYLQNFNLIGYRKEAQILLGRFDSL